MKKTLKQFLMVFGLMTVALTVFSALPEAAFAQGFLSDEDRIGAVDSGTGGESSLRRLVIRIINYFLGFLGILAVIMVIYGGVMYVTSQGSEESTGNAKKIIMYAVIGIIIILLSFALVNTILGAGLGVES